MRKIKNILLITIFSFSLLFTSINSSSVVYGITGVQFSDVSYTDWFTNSVSRLINLGAINGYDDNTFRPYNNMTREEFVKVLITSLYSEEEIPLDEEDELLTGKLNYIIEYWGTPYLKKAEATGIIDDYIMAYYDYSVSGLKEPITRGEIAYLIMHVEEKVKGLYIDEEAAFDYDDGYYMYLINDIQYDDAPIAEAEVVCYKYGIVSGYPDKTYRSDEYATRAEVVTILSRYIYENTRVSVDTSTIPFNVDESGTPMFRESAFQRPVHYAYDDPYIIYRTDYINAYLEMYEQIGMTYYEEDSDYYRLFSVKFGGRYADRLEKNEMFVYTGHIRLILSYGTLDVDSVFNFVEETEVYIYHDIDALRTYDLNIVGKDGIKYKIVCEVRDDDITYVVYQHQ